MKFVKYYSILIMLTALYLPIKSTHAYNAESKIQNLGAWPSAAYGLRFMVGTDTDFTISVGSTPLTGTGTAGFMGTSTVGSSSFGGIRWNGTLKVWQIKGINTATWDTIGTTTVSYLDSNFIKSNAGTGSGVVLTDSTLNGGTLSGNVDFTGTLTANGKSITPTKVGYLDLVSSDIQTQINGKQADLGGAYVASLSDDVGTSTGSVRLKGGGDITVLKSGNLFTVSGSLGANAKPDVTEGGTGTITTPTFHDFDANDFDISASGSGAVIALSTAQKGTSTVGSPNTVVKTDADGNIIDYLDITGNDQYTKLLLHFNETGSPTTFLDSSEQEFTVSNVGNAHGTNTQSVFGGRSLVLDGAGDRLTIADNARLELGSNDFIIDFRMRLTDIVAPYLLTKEQTAVSDYILINYVGADDRLDFTQKSSSATVVNASSGSCSVSLNTWYHVAIVRKRDKFRFYIDGIQKGSDSVDTDAIVDNTGVWAVGGVASDSNGVNGYFDEFRMSIGCGRKMSNFTVPTKEYGTFSPYLTK